MNHAGLAVFLATNLLAAAVAAVTPQRASVNNQELWLKGRAEGLLLTASGTVVLSPHRTIDVAVEEPVVWTVATTKDDSVWLGTGSNGHLLRYKSDGTLAETVLLPELQVTAIVSAGDDVFAATSPDGAIYRIHSGNEAEVVARPLANYIWSLAIGRGGELFAATGVEGIIYRIRNGEVDVFYDSEDVHVTSLVAAADDTLIAGTAERGLVLAIDAKGSASVLYDSDYKEARAVAVSKSGAVFAAINGGASFVDSEAPPQPGQATVTVTASAGAGAGPAPAGPPQPTALGLMPPEAFGDVSAEVVRIDQDGSVEVVARTRGEIVHALAFDAAGDLIIGTSKRLLKPVGIDQVTVVALGGDLPTAQVSALVRGRARLFVATTEPTRLLALVDAATHVGTYTSDVIVSPVVAVWGAVTADVDLAGQATIGFETRSGSTREPGAAWSAWASLDGNRKVVSPSARFLQWRMRLESTSRDAKATNTAATVYSVAVTYLPRNRRPTVKSVVAHPPGVVFQKAAGPPNVVEAQPPPIPGIFEELKAAAMDGSQPGMPMYRRGAQTLSWEVEDADGDALVTSLSVRARTGGPWLPMIERPDGNNYAFDTGVLPDGWYIARLQITDKESNPSGTGLTAERDSPSFRIDNTPPRVTLNRSAIERQRARVRFDAQDVGSGLWKAEWSVDGTPFIPVSSVDQLTDGAVETFEIESEPLTAGDHLMVLRVFDLDGNTASSGVALSVPK